MTRRAAALAALLALGGTIWITHALADGRGDWHGYAWQTIAVADCSAQASGPLLCPPFHEKWDWKRDQWVDISITFDSERERLHLRQQLTGRDQRDSDYVCVTALVLDADGHNLVVHHQNWRMRGGESRAADFSYPSPLLASAATIQIGSKQCREGASEDDDVYAAVLARLSQTPGSPG